MSELQNTMQLNINTYICVLFRYIIYIIRLTKESKNTWS